MTGYRKKPVKLEAWRLPPLGQAAEQPIPDWLMSEFTDLNATFNRYGGVNIKLPGVTYSCLPGDFIVRTETGDIEVIKADRFKELVEPVRR